MSISEQQRNDRRNFIGSSDVAAILGMDPYGRNQRDVYWSKVGEVDRDATSTSMEAGNLFESTLVDWAARKIGATRVVKDKTVLSLEIPILGANLDALVLDGDRPVSCIEAKWVTAFNPEFQSWGKSETQEIPHSVSVQVMHQMFCGQLDFCDVVSAVAGDLRLYRIPRDEESIQAIAHYCRAWWDKHVARGVEPDGDPPRLDTVKYIKRVMGESRAIDPCLIESYELAKERELEAKKEKDAAYANILAAMGTASVAEYGDSKKVYSLIESFRSSLDGQSLMREMPDVYERYMKESKFKTLRKVHRR